MRWPWSRSKQLPLLHVAIDEGTGPTVVLVHGIASSTNAFENVIPLLTPQHRVIALDLLGFGASPSPAGATYTIEEHVEHLEHTLAALGIERCIIVGHSLGSLIAARYAATHADEVRGLVLVSPPVYLPPESFGDPVERTAMGLYLRAYEFLRNNKRFTMRNAAVLARLSPIRDVLEVSERNWRAFTLSLEHVIETQTAVSDIAAVSAPVQVVYGTLDPFLMPGGLRIIEQMRHVSVHRVAGGDHVIRRRMARVVATAVASVSAHAADLR
ncbi:alpha/beta fold hydrolase [Agrococcus carbonis]|uniref:Pimeloyl-ACP methyl ester carboxylesterase n=1 Tax=Agrococcus carbonis TaxID=684552 RepID=A0A1H1T2N5_9MICO|nr:alpha/beta hydrolase [Agrococcus carbonis]SDS54507.1 Pimeloyl-ACP methyl ester carboxylesterase [Agrococcus carbonis]